MSNPTLTLAASLLLAGLMADGLAQPPAANATEKSTATNAPAIRRRMGSTGPQKQNSDKPQKASSPLPDLPPTAPLITVNGDTITWGAMLRHAELMIAEFRLPDGVTIQDFQEERDNIILRQVYNLAKNYIVKTLFAQEARKHKIALLPQEVEAKKKEIFDKVRQTKKNPDIFLREFETAGSFFQFDLTNSLLYAHLKSDVIRPAITVTDADIHAACNRRDELNRQIVATNATLRPKLEGLLKKIREGADFGEIAFAESDCDSSHDNGEWGTFKRENLRKELADAAFNMEEGQLSDVVETPFSYHIIKLHKKNRGFAPKGSTEPAPIISVKIAHIMLEKKNTLPPHTPESARKEILDEREKATLKELEEQLLSTANIETPLTLF